MKKVKPNPNDSTLIGLLAEKKQADRLFFMAIHRRKTAKLNLDNYLKSLTPEKKPSTEQMELAL